MSDLKRVMISLPSSLLEEVDCMVALEKRNRSEFIREAMKLYLNEKKKMELREHLKRGYIEMAKLNLELAEEGLLLSEGLDLVADGHGGGG